MDGRKYRGGPTIEYNSATVSSVLAYIWPSLLYAYLLLALSYLLSLRTLHGWKSKALQNFVMDESLRSDESNGHFCDPSGEIHLVNPAECGERIDGVHSQSVDTLETPVVSQSPKIPTIEDIEKRVWLDSPFESVGGHLVNDYFPWAELPSFMASQSLQCLNWPEEVPFPCEYRPDKKKRLSRLQDISAGAIYELARAFGTKSTAPVLVKVHREDLLNDKIPVIRGIAPPVTSPNAHGRDYYASGNVSLRGLPRLRSLCVSQQSTEITFLPPLLAEDVGGCPDMAVEILADDNATDFSSKRRRFSQPIQQEAGHPCYSVKPLTLRGRDTDDRGNMLRFQEQHRDAMPTQQGAEASRGYSAALMPDGCSMSTGATDESSLNIDPTSISSISTGIDDPTCASGNNYSIMSAQRAMIALEQSVDDYEFLSCENAVFEVPLTSNDEFLMTGEKRYTIPLPDPETMSPPKKRPRLHIPSEEKALYERRPLTTWDFEIPAPMTEYRKNSTHTQIYLEHPSSYSNPDFREHAIDVEAWHDNYFASLFSNDIVQGHFQYPAHDESIATKPTTASTFQN
ncbi:hypothetical protein CVT26_006376 [Gymnopilus dilepis]|uniref:Uncharacterized protein n=1 Tax=Gymnopilus dilepis TaxID=231916 RepID=A0A409Y0M4_9AGAR|nr:hypothetical protein CVT26_006376 [Gymnopilus dilepis]